jgi:hypothetical protein
MIVYSATKKCFREDVFTNNIDQIILNFFKIKTERLVGMAEINSWKNSLQYMDRLLEDESIPEDVGVSIEYHIPQTSKCSSNRVEAMGIFRTH